MPQSNHSRLRTFQTQSPPTVLCLHFNSIVFHTFNQISIVYSFGAQRNQKHFFLFFLVVAGGLTGWGESCWWGAVGWGVTGGGKPSGGSPTFHVRTTCPSCRRKSCSTLEREGDNIDSKQAVNETLTQKLIDYCQFRVKWFHFHSLSSLSRKSWLLSCKMLHQLTASDCCVVLSMQCSVVF